MMRSTLLAALSCALVLGANANNIQVTNATLTGNTGSAAMVQFDLSWENSWRGGGLPNWDAAWVFVKYRDVNNVWHHVYLGESGHVLPSGSGAALSTGLKQVGAAFNAVTNPVVGAFVHRGMPGSGTFAMVGIQLKWNYADQGVAYADIDDIGVFGIEMVYVPEGAFLVGQSSGSPEFALTHINTPDATIAPTGGQGPLGSPQGGYPEGSTYIPELPDMPNGYMAFYCMKYELSQQTYADYLNTLTYDQQMERTAVLPTAPAGTPALNGSARNGLVIAAPSIGIGPAYFGCDLNGNSIMGEAGDGTDIAVNWVSAEDYVAFLDWSGLRAMTSMEYEKACRGPALPQTGEFAWGNTAIMTTPYLLADPGTPAEGIALGYQTTLGNANHAGTSTAYEGPVRLGCFAANPANNGRMTAGATFHGIMEMSGNLREFAADLNSDVTYGTHGDGALTMSGAGDAFVVSSSSGLFFGLGTRGGSWDTSLDFLRITWAGIGASSPDSRLAWAGIRCIRSAP